MNPSPACQGPPREHQRVGHTTSLSRGSSRSNALKRTHLYMHQAPPLNSGIAEGAWAQHVAYLMM